TGLSAATWGSFSRHDWTSLFPYDVSCGSSYYVLRWGKRIYYGVYSLRPLRATNMNDEAPLTITVPEAGKRYFNLSRDASYAAAQRGDIPTIRIGRLLRVPVRAMERLLDSSRRGGAAS